MCPQSREVDPTISMLCGQKRKGRGWKEGVQGWDSRATGERRSGHSAVLVWGLQKPQK